MDKLEALKKQYEGDIKQIDDTTFTINGNTYKCYDDDELEDAAREDIREFFEYETSDEYLNDWVTKNGGLINFFNEVYINDFRIEDSETFGDLSDEEIVEMLTNEYGYIDFKREAFDIDKIVDYVYDIDGAQGLSRVDGEIIWVDGGYNLIKED